MLDSCSLSSANIQLYIILDSIAHMQANYHAVLYVDGLETCVSCVDGYQVALTLQL